MGDGILNKPPGCFEICFGGFFVAQGAVFVFRRFG
jgi:hypothetical protein